MTPADIDRVFGRSRLKMVTGEHVEVFREEAPPGERRRYTKRFLCTTEGDFRHWTEREWRILARLVGHGIGPVPDVVQFDRGATGRPALVQTYDAGVTVDHWATLLPVERSGRALHHVFEDCAHWWALAQHCLIALDAIHELHLVHLDLKADNVCIPLAPADFDPHRPGQVLHPRFGQIALIDFAFSLVAGDSLATALPIGHQADYAYQSPRLLRALEAGRRGDLAPTRQLDWRCDIFSLAAMLQRYLPVPGTGATGAWTDLRHADAQALIARLLDAHSGLAAAQRPHRELIAMASTALGDPGLAASLEQGWHLSDEVLVPRAQTPTPVTRIVLPMHAVPESGGDGVSRPASAQERRNGRIRSLLWTAGMALAGIACVPFMAQAWLALQESAMSRPTDEQVAAATLPMEEIVEPPPPGAGAVSAPAGAPDVEAAPEPATEPAAQAAPTPAPVAVAAPAAARPSPRAPAPKRTPARKAATARNVAVVRKSAAAPKAATASMARLLAAPRFATGAAPGIAATPVASVASAAPVVAAPAAPAAVSRQVTAAAAATPAMAALPQPPAADPSSAAALLPQEFGARASTLIAEQLPHISQRAERLVLRVLHAAARMEDGWQDADVLDAARAVRLAPDEALAGVARAAADAQRLNDAAGTAFWNGRDPRQALDLQLRAFGADPQDEEVAGNLAYYYLKQRPAQPEVARRMALYALALHAARFPTGRIEDWTTLAIASALVGRERDASNALFVTLVLSPNLGQTCRAASAAYALHGERLRVPAEALLSRIRTWGRSQESPFCRWPPSWPAGARAP